MNIAYESNYITLHQSLNANRATESINLVLKEALQIIEAAQAAGQKVESVSCLNILDRESNPDGHNVFLRVRCTDGKENTIQP